MIRCEWSNFDARIEDPTIPLERCIETAEWVSCEPFIGARTCPVHKCRCAKPLPKDDCAPPDLKPYRGHQREVERFAKCAPIIGPSGTTGPSPTIIGATGSTGPAPQVLATSMAMGVFEMANLGLKPKGPSTPDKNVITEMLKEMDDWPDPEMGDDDDPYKSPEDDDFVDERLHPPPLDDDPEVIPRDDRWMLLDLPKGWTFWGILPILEPEIIFGEMKPGDMIELDQDIFTIWSPEKPMPRFHIDVGWYPDYDPKGQYRCVVVTTDDLPKGSDNPWDQPPLYEFKTRKTSAVWHWLSEVVSIIYERYYRTNRPPARK